MSGSSFPQIEINKMHISQSIEVGAVRRRAHPPPWQWAGPHVPEPYAAGTSAGAHGLSHCTGERVQRAPKKRIPRTACGSLLCPALAARVRRRGLSFQRPAVVMPGHSAEGPRALGLLILQCVLRRLRPRLSQPRQGEAHSEAALQTDAVGTRRTSTWPCCFPWVSGILQLRLLQNMALVATCPSKSEAWERGCH